MLFHNIHAPATGQLNNGAELLRKIAGYKTAGGRQFRFQAAFHHAELKPPDSDAGQLLRHL